jgi:rSAM/selenodomain-associated transferase 1
MAPSENQPAANVLGVFAKEPRPGHVKSRLAAQSNWGWAAEVATAFLRDTLDRLAQVAAHRILAFSPPQAEAYFAGLTRGRFALRPQCEGDLGRRMQTFFAEELALGAERVVLVGTDSPTLPLDFIDQALRALAAADVVLGPATDGGYYLIGVARRVPPLFDGIAWGGSRVLLDTIRRAGEACLKLAVLPPWYDVDTRDDWWALCGHLAALRLAGIDPGVPHTEALARA